VRRHCCGWRGTQVIYDLLVKSSGPLELREDPDQGMCVAGLKHISVNSAAEIMASGNCMQYLPGLLKRILHALQA
jgi:hypothetical protein